MRYYDARQREHDGRWDYTCRHDDRIYPVGYCAGFRPYKADDVVVRSEEHARELNAELEPFREKYHTDGHATPEEARACYREYLLDQRLRFVRWEHTTPSGEEVLPGTLSLCNADGCTEYTPHYAAIRGTMESWYLCDDHLDRETVEALYDGPGRMARS